MKTRVKTTEKARKWYDNDYWVRKHPTADAWINMMAFSRSVMMMRGIDTIVKDAVRYANERGERVSYKHTSSERRMRLCLEGTEKAVKAGGATSVKAHRMTVRLWAGKSNRSGRGSAQGFTTAIGNGPNLPHDCIPVMLHELTHTIHLVAVNPHVASGKMRPHDLCYNRIQLKLMQKVFKLTEKDLNGHPKYHGYSIGRGYAPSRSAFRILNKLIEDQDPRVMKWFTAEQPVVKEKKKRGPSKTAWIRTMEQWMRGDIAYKSDELWSGGIYDGQKAIDYEEAGDREWEFIQKVRAGDVLNDRDLHLFQLLVRDCEAELWDDELISRSETLRAGYDWWLENVQM